MYRRRPSVRVRLPFLLGLLLVAATATGCAGEAPSTLSPSGPKSDVAASSWWILFGVAAFVCVVVIALTVLAAIVRRRARTVHDNDAKGFVLTFGVVIPALVFGGTFVLSVMGLQRTSHPQTDPDTTIQVIGHQWWWEVRYGDGTVTANEIHVPVGQPVEVTLSSADVIHSFWVPELMPKMDMIPGRVNHTWFTADKAGVYHGQCAEYCGLQHAHMGFDVVAEPKSDFDSWLADQGSDAATPTSSLASRGMDVFTSTTCATCHTIRGTSADGDVGPDLTHVGSRARLAAGAIPNDRGHLAGWIGNSQTVKPGNRMPPQHLSPDDLQAVVTYLEGLT